MIKLEAEDTDLRFGSDGCLRESVEMETSEDAKPVVKLEEAVTGIEDYFDKEKQKIDKEDALIFGSDSWLKNSVEMEEEEDEAKSNIKLENKDALRALVNQAQLNNCAKPKPRPRAPIIIKIKKEHRDTHKIEDNYAKAISTNICNENPKVTGKPHHRRYVSKKGSRVGNIKFSVKLLANCPVVKNADVSKVAATGLCTFSCTDCPATYTMWSQIRKHMDTKHDKVINLLSYELYLTKATVHVCKICSEKIFCEASILHRHLIKKHKMTVVEYRKKYSCKADWKEKMQNLLENGKLSPNRIGNLCSFKCPQCQSTYLAYSTFVKHCKESKKCHVNTKSMFWVEHLEKVIVHRCRFCSKPLLCDGETIQKHVKHSHGMKSLDEYAKAKGLNNVLVRGLKIQEVVSNGKDVTEEVGNFCEFTCSRCKHVTKSWRLIKRHLRVSEHGWSANQSCSDYISKTVLHKCVICDGKVVNDWEYLNRHLNIRHQTTLPQYVKKYNITHIKSTTSTRR